MSKIFFITGVSSGFGRAIAAAALKDGNVVAGTVRRQSDAQNFEALQPGRAHACLLDVTDDDEVIRAVEDVESRVGPIDVVIANAGYAHEGTIEESTMDELRRQFAVNVFGALAVVKAVLPHMRRRRAGHILTITSEVGLFTIPALGFYQGSKYALEGLTETLGKEVAPLGIHVIAVEPGEFRTDVAGRSLQHAQRTISEYDGVYSSVRGIAERSGRQAGDPDKAAQAILQILDVPNPPAHLLLGSDAVQAVSAARAALDADLHGWESLSRSTDFVSPTS